MKTKRNPLLLLLGLTSVLCCFIGCSSQPEATTPTTTKDATASTGAGAADAGKKSGNVMNTDVMPAPSGVNTGTQGGQK